MSGPATGSDPLHASGAIDAGGVTATCLKGMSVPAVHVLGTYPLTLEQPIDAAECTIQITLRGDPTGLAITPGVVHTSDTVKTVLLWDVPGAALVDHDFDINIFRVRVG